MRLLDLFCGSGGAAKGYEVAGFDSIVGVDIDKTVNYPYKFIWDDVMDYINENDLSSFDLIHASPPCQAYTWGNHKDKRRNHEKYISELREILSDYYYVIENVIGSDLNEPIILEGNMFNLPIKRTRLFETNWFCEQPERKKYNNKVLVTLAGNGGQASSFKYYHYMQATKIWWMTKKQLIQAIPPAYTEYIGKEFLKRHANKTNCLSTTTK